MIDHNKILFNIVVVQILFLTAFAQYFTTTYALRTGGSGDWMKCSYGERGSLTATCVNATPQYFKSTPYRFDHLDETLRCLNCSLETIESGTFDISGNQIKYLDLSSSSISTIKPRAFVGLIFLQTLNLNNNQIKSIYPNTFTGVKKITRIDLEFNQISTLSERGFQELINLKELNLRNNQIKNIVTTAFEGLSSLTVLDLSNNNLAEVSHIFDNLTSLQSLDLTNNSISVLHVDDFTNLTSILEIKLGHNLIKSIPQYAFSEMLSLKSLVLAWNLVERIIPGSFHGLSNLQDLDLAYNNLADIPQKTLQSLHALTKLNISNNKLSDFQTGLYSGLPQLRQLNLSNNAISNLEITGVFELHSLHTLDLSVNNLSDFDFVSLIDRMPRIAYLNLQDNSLPCGLEKEMSDYFSQDNFKFLLQRYDKGAPQCIDKPTISKVNKDSWVRVDDRYRGNDHSVAIIWLFVLVTIVLTLISGLFYLQYRTQQELRIWSMSKKSTSQVQLINSDLEARDNDYLKE